MSSTYATPQEALTNLLQNASTLCPQIVWGATASPFYQEVPEPDVVFPYVWFDIPDSNQVYGFEFAGHEEFTATIRVYMREQDIAASASPYTLTSPFYYLDTFACTPRTMDGANFECIKFRRESWRLYKDNERGPDVGRVWIAECKYSLWITA